MKLSIIIPIGNLDEWKVCETSLRESIDAYAGSWEAEIVAVEDLAHEGAYIARNKGLKRATGDWITWVDCDDVVEPAWFATICRAIDAEPSCDMLVFGIIEEKDGKSRTIYSPRAHIEEGEKYARWMIGGLGMPHWLWHRAFRRELWEGVRFEGRVKQDYQASLQFLPRVKRVQFIPDCLYHYIRHGHGLSNYVQKMDYDAACKGFLTLVDRLPESWRHEGRRGVGLMVTDVILHDKRAKGANKYLRPFFWEILFLRGMSFRFRVKAILATLMFWR